MKYSKDEILNAIKIIRETCESEKEGCSNCPFGTGFGDCVLCKKIPKQWRSQEERVWRAVE